MRNVLCVKDDDSMCQLRQRFIRERDQMDDLQYYRLELRDHSTVSFCSFSKAYFGTIDDIRILINALDEKHRDSYGELVAAFRAYEEGRTEVTHHAAFQEVPLLTPAKLIHRERLVLENHTLEHENIWQCIYKMRCERVETEHLWLECEGRWLRMLKAKFKGLQHEDALGGWKTIREGMLWGFPCTLQGDSECFRNVLAEPEKGFKNKKGLEQDWENFKRSPDPVFDEFCNDIYGDG